MLKHLREYIDFDNYDIDETDSQLTDKTFVKFLKDNNIHDKFIYNLQQFIHKRKKKGLSYTKISDFCNKTDNIDYILYSFSWSDTPEGADFWSGYNNKWWKELHFINISND